MHPSLEAARKAQAEGRPEDAQRLYARAIEAGQDVDAEMDAARVEGARRMHEQARSHWSQGRIREAAAAFQRAARLDPQRYSRAIVDGLRSVLGRMKSEGVLNSSRLAAHAAWHRARESIDTAIEGERWDGVEAALRTLDEQRRSVMADRVDARLAALCAEGRHDAERAGREMLIRFGAHKAFEADRIATCLRRAGRSREALHWLDQAAEAEPDNPDRWRRLAWQEYQHGKLAPAAEHFDRAIALRPDDVGALEGRALIRARRSDADGAAADAIAAVRADADSAVIALVTDAWPKDRPEGLQRFVDLTGNARFPG